MITRRTAIRLALGSGLALSAGALAPAEFWNDKQPADWSEKEVQRLLTKSPWAKEVAAEMNFAGMGMPPGGGPMGGGAPPGGMDGPGGPMDLTAGVRWESAASIRDAANSRLPEDAAEYYVISLHGLPMMGAGRGAGFPGAFGGDGLQGMQARLRESTSLQRKGKKPIAPVRIRTSEDDGVLLFYFPRDPDPISIEDKEVVFVTALGPLEVKAKFPLKEMTYRGKLAL